MARGVTLSRVLLSLNRSWVIHFSASSDTLLIAKEESLFYKCLVFSLSIPEAEMGRSLGLRSVWSTD